MQASPETRLFRGYWQDGTLDLVAGCGVVIIGIGFLFEQFLGPAVAVPLGFAGWLILRRRVVEPRAGYVELAGRRRRNSARELTGAAGAGVGLLVLVVAVALWGRSDTTTVARAVDGLPALLVGLAALVTAGLTRSWRFVAYAAVMAAMGLVAALTAIGPAIPLLAGGVVAMGTGTVLLIGFLRESRQFAEEE